MDNERAIVGKLVFHGTVNIFIAFGSGAMIALAAMGQIDGQKQDWLLAHMESLINGMMLFIVAGFIGKLVISPKQAIIATYCLIGMAYCNTVFGIGRGATGALGYEFNDNLGNNITALAGQLGVPLAIVAFSLIGLAAWRTR
ncbi:hypothetical protein [Litorivivens sp.]|uniref:hypothetical protein n=1 Tax=Litorivivens sp. TaxID=2020868 RepID=UPI003565F335